MLGVLLLVIRLKGKTYEHLVLFLHLSQRGGDIRIGHQMDIHCLSYALDFLFCHLRRTEVSYSRTKDSCICLREKLRCCIIHILTTLYVNATNVSHLTLYTDRTSNDCHLGTSACTFLCQCKAHLATGVITNETHWVYLLVGRSCSNQDTLTQ